MELITLSYVAAFAGLGLGLFAAVNPRGAAKLVGIRIDPDLPHSISEIRATYGGVFAGGHAFALISGSETAFVTLGCAWLAAGAVRAASMVRDGAINGANLGGTAFELVMGALLAWPLVIR